MSQLAPEFSIIVPLYNKEEYIAAAVESILAQTFPSYEVIVVDDGSTDNGVAIVESYNDRRIVVIRKCNGGVSSARNEGLRNAKGTWILFLDADDKLASNALAEVNALTRSYRSLLVFITGFWCVGSAGYRTMGYGRTELVVRNGIRSLWYRTFYPRPGNTYMHKSVFGKIKGFDERLAFNEDLEFSMRLLAVFSCVYTPKKLMYYSEYAQGESRKPHAFEKNFASCIQEISIDTVYKRLVLYCVFHYGWYIAGEGGSKRERKIAMMEVLGKDIRGIYFLFASIRRIANILRGGSLSRW